MTEIDVLKKDTAYLSIISNTVLVLLKLFVGIWVGAVSLISEALHSSVDLLASLIAFWAVKKSVTPPDTEHDYGHGKFENLSAAVEALLIVAAAGGIVYEAFEHLGQDKVPEMLHFGVAIMAVSIIINLVVSQKLISVGKLTESQALEADGLHLRADVWTSVGVMLGLILMEFTGWAWLDGAIAIVVAVMASEPPFSMYRLHATCPTVLRCLICPLCAELKRHLPLNPPTVSVDAAASVVTTWATGSLTTTCRLARTSSSRI